jgi:hypothetical protein
LLMGGNSKSQNDQEESKWLLLLLEIKFQTIGH